MNNFLIDILSKFSAVTAGCENSFFGFPTWYKYLDSGVACAPVLNELSDVWLIVLALVEILLRLVAIAAVVYVVYGGFKYMTSRGNPDKINSARITIQDALIGLVIAIAATAVVSFVGNRIS